MFCCILGCLLFPICIEFVFSCTVLLVSINQVIGCEDRLRNDLYCVEWGVKLYSSQPCCLRRPPAFVACGEDVVLEQCGDEIAGYVRTLDAQLLRELGCETTHKRRPLSEFSSVFTMKLVAWHSGRTSVSGRRTFPVLRSTCS